MATHDELAKSIIEAAFELRKMFSSTEYPDGMVRYVLEDVDIDLWNLIDDLNDDDAIQDFIDGEDR